MNKEIEDLRADVEELKEEVALLKGLAPPKMTKQLSELTAELKALKQEVESMKDTINQQNKTILKLLKEQRQMIEHIGDCSTNGTSTTIKTSQTFPLDTLEQLDTFESLINDDNINEYINTLRILLNNGGMRKHLNEILGKNLVMEVNIRGTNNKVSLSDYKKFMDAIFQATLATQQWSFNAFMDEFRVALRMAKNRVHKYEYDIRKRGSKKVEPESKVKFEEIFFDDDDDGDDD